MGGITGASDTCCDAPVMLDTPCDAPHDGGVTYHSKTPLNINIYPSTLFFLKMLAISMILRGGGVVPGRGGVGGGPTPIKHTFSTK